MLFPDGRQQFRAVHPGHADIGDEHIEGLAIQHLERLETRCHEPQVAFIVQGTQSPLQRLQQSGFVIHKKDAFHWSSRLAGAPRR